MFWPFVFNLCVGLLLAAYLLRAVRRFERRADAVMAGLDRWEAEEFRKYDIAEAEIKASMRAKGDAAIAEMQAKGTVQPHSFTNEFPVADIFKFTQTAGTQSNGTSANGEIRARQRRNRCLNCADLMPNTIDGHVTNARSAYKPHEVVGVQLHVTPLEEPPPAEGA